MIQRNAQETLLRLAERFPAVAITGPRQSGKSALARAAFPDKRYISLADPDYRELARSDPGDFLRAFPGGLVIDEAQRVPELFDAVELAADAGTCTPGKYILIGSCRFRRKTDASGSVGCLELLPLSLQELAAADALPDDPYDLFLRGGYPSLHDPEKPGRADDWYEHYTDSYLELDVRDQIHPSNRDAFRKFLPVCALQSGQLVNYDRMAREVGVSAVTVKHWCSVLETSYLIHFVAPDPEDLGRTVVRTPKLYFTDSGLLCYLLRLASKEDLLLSRRKDAIVETAAVSELCKARYNMAETANLTFYRDKNGFEVDLVADWACSFAMEIKSSRDAGEKLASGVRRYVRMRQDGTGGQVLYLGDVSCEVRGVQYLSWKDWGTQRLLPDVRRAADRSSRTAEETKKTESPKSGDIKNNIGR